MTTYVLPMELPRAEVAVRDSDSKSAEARWLAALALAGVHDDARDAAIGALEKLLEDPVEEIRAQAVEGMASHVRAGADVKVELVGALVSDPSDAVRCAVIASADLFFDDPRVTVMSALDDAEPSVRAAAARFLGEAGAAEATDALARLVEDVDPVVRRESALAAARVGDSRGARVLLSMLEGDISTAVEAANAMGELGGEQFADGLLKVASGVFGDPDLKAAAAIAAARCGSPRGREIVEKMLSAVRASIRMCVYRALSVSPLSGCVDALARNASTAKSMEISSILNALHSCASSDREAVLAALQALRPLLEDDLVEELEEIVADLEGKQ